ncbi:MAG: NAD-dependent deacylase [Acidobacteria bacterium]|nr:MAG: NAD-dependent deacylase [Acidobacteriota bacterium]
MSPAEITEELKRRFRRARRVVVLTGAGISAESGVPTFRGGGGSAVWRGFPFEQISSAEMLARDPALVWEWFNYRRQVISQARPNAAHRALAEWEKRFQSLVVITQNIDDLHRAAGSRTVLELHGNIWRVRCLSCGRVTENRQVPLREIPPTCTCGGMLRPDVVLFGEALPGEVLHRAQAEAARCELFFIVGTSAIVYPAAYLPVIAKHGGAYVVEVNPETTPVSSLVDVTLSGKAGEVLPALSEA